MNVVCLFDLPKGSGPLAVTVVAEEKLPKELKSETFKTHAAPKLPRHPGLDRDPRHRAAETC